MTTEAAVEDGNAQAISLKRPFSIKRPCNQIFLVKSEIPELQILEKPFQQRYWQIQSDSEIDWTRGVQYANNPSRHQRFPVRTIDHLLNRFVDEQDSERSRDSCRYTMDPMDHCFLSWFNQRIAQKLAGLSATELETMMLKLEDNLFAAVRKEHGRAYVKDEDICCDICRGNRVCNHDEIVFCDICEVAVHRRCYGVATPAKGNWICRPCAVNTRPKCKLCPSRFGAFKPVEHERSWSHISCALFIPEVKIGQQKYMEPICNLSAISSDRWNSTCTLCDVKYGCCVKCSAPECIRAFHVTCALDAGLWIKADLEDPTVRRIKFEDCSLSSPKRPRSADPFLVLCPVHTAHIQKTTSGRPFIDVIRETRRNYVRKCEPVELMKATGICVEFADVVKYWKNKRLALQGRNPSGYVCNIEKQWRGEADEHAEMNSHAKVLVSIRQSLELVRNLCHIVLKRERLKQTLYQTTVKKPMHSISRQVITCTEETSSIKITSVEDALQHKYFPGTSRPHPCSRESDCASKITRKSLYFENGSF